MAQSLSSPIDALPQSSRWADDSASDDEIVWSLASSGEFSGSFASVASRAVPGSPRSDDFILISRPSSPSSPAATSADAQALAEAFSSLSMQPVTSANIQSTRAVAKPRAKNPKPTTATNNTPTHAITSQTKQKPQPSSPKYSRKKSRSRSKTPEQLEKSATNSYPSPPSSPAQNRTIAKKSATTTPPTSPSKLKKKKKRTSAGVPTAGAQAVTGVEGETTGLGQRTVVDDVSEVGDEKESPVYDQARDFMSKYLANPPPSGNNGSTLLLCQALIIELGLHSTFSASGATAKSVAPSYFSNSNLPRSVTQAKAVLKSHAFISIRDYLAEREHGPVALRNAMHGSRKSLIKDIRRMPNKRAPLKWVKERGLNVLLVNTRA